MAFNKQNSDNKQQTTTPLTPDEMLAIKGGNGDTTPPVPPQEIVIEDIVNG